MLRPLVCSPTVLAARPFVDALCVKQGQGTTCFSSTVFHTSSVVRWRPSLPANGAASQSTGPTSSGARQVQRTSPRPSTCASSRTSLSTRPTSSGARQFQRTLQVATPRPSCAVMTRRSSRVVRDRTNSHAHAQLRTRHRVSTLPRIRTETLGLSQAARLPALSARLSLPLSAFVLYCLASLLCAQHTCGNSSCVRAPAVTPCSHCFRNPLSAPVMDSFASWSQNLSVVDSRNQCEQHY